MSDCLLLSFNALLKLLKTGKINVLFVNNSPSQNTGGRQKRVDLYLIFTRVTSFIKSSRSKSKIECRLALDWFELVLVIDSYSNHQMISIFKDVIIISTNVIIISTKEQLIWLLQEK